MVWSAFGAVEVLYQGRSGCGPPVYQRSVYKMYIYVEVVDSSSTQQASIGDLVWVRQVVVCGV